MSRAAVTVVVSRREDAADLSDHVVITADEYITGAETTAGSTVVNLCRSISYGSDGYYVSLLADARAHAVLPTLETGTGLSDSYQLFRALQEAGVPTLDRAEAAVRQREAGHKGLLEDEFGPLPLVSVDGRWQVPPASDIAEFVVCGGKPQDQHFSRLAAQVFDVWRAPLLRLRVVHDDGAWKVAGVAHASPQHLSDAQRALLCAALSTACIEDDQSASDDVRASIAILMDPTNPFSPSSPATIDRLERVAARMNVHLARLTLTDLRRLPEYDALFIRALTGVTLPSFQFALRAEALDMPVIDDAQSIMRCTNKVFLAELLGREGVPLPRTVIVTEHTTWKELGHLGLPLVLKLPDSSFSAAVHKITSEEEFSVRAREMLTRSPLLIAQEWVPTAFDWRVAVLDGELLFAARYYMAHGHWQIRREDHGEERYGKVEAVARTSVPKDVADIAVRAARLIGRGMYGVDIKQTPRGPVVIEVNENANLDTGYEDVADGDAVYTDIVGYFLRRIEESDTSADMLPTLATAPFSTARRGSGAGSRQLQRSGRGRRVAAYEPFSVAGLELEYPTVNADLDVVSLVEPAFRAIAGRGTSDIELDRIGFSNEIADHVFEVKTLEPVATLRDAEDAIVNGIRRFAEVLQQEWNARLLPTGMHPWFDPMQGRLWTRSGLRIYTAYARIFDVRSHGWMNVHSTHLNLPFGNERETMAMHTAAALLVPYLPALAASSPMHDGILQPCVDARLAWIVRHQSRIPETCGRIVPEPVDSFAAYRREILTPMYAALDEFPHSELLRQEFLNARGAVLRFARRALELRVLDTQECVHMDVAIATFARAALRQLTRDVLDGRVTAPPFETLVADFEECVRAGGAARVHAPHLRESATSRPNGAAETAARVKVRTVLDPLLVRVRHTIDADDTQYLDLVEKIIVHGTLGERIRQHLEAHAGTPEQLRTATQELYGELAECLLRNEPWHGRWDSPQSSNSAAAQPQPMPRSRAASSPSGAGSMR